MLVICAAHCVWRYRLRPDPKYRLYGARYAGPKAGRWFRRSRCGIYPEAVLSIRSSVISTGRLPPPAAIGTRANRQPLVFAAGGSVVITRVNDDHPGVGRSRPVRHGMSRRRRSYVFPRGCAKHHHQFCIGDIIGLLPSLPPNI